MDAAAFFVQALNGFASASSLFLVAVGLSLIFGVSRIVNFAHGSFYMLGLYLAYSLNEWLTPMIGSVWSFWLAMPLSAMAVGLLGGVCEITVLRRIYRAPALFQLLATFALVLIMQDAVLWLWGADDLLGPRAAGLSGRWQLGERRFPSYDVFLIFIGPLVWWLLQQWLTRSRKGLFIRAATQDRDMVNALGQSPRGLFTSVFMLGCGLAALGGALQLPREPAHLGLDLQTIGDAFVVVVVAGMGSLKGAYLAALLIAQVKALCIGVGTVEWQGVTFALSKLTLVAEFFIMAVVLILRPWGLQGQAQTEVRATHQTTATASPSKGAKRLLVGLAIAVLCLPLVVDATSYQLVLLIDMLCAVLFACSLQFMMGTGGLHSFGHAAYFGLGAYAAALLSLHAGFSMFGAMALAPGLSALVAAFIGWFCVRLSGVYFSMLTLAMAQILWSVIFQWDSFTGGSNGLTGVWPEGRWVFKPYFYEVVAIITLVGVYALRHLTHTPLGFALRASRDAPARANALGIHVPRLQWLAFVIAAFFAGVAGVLFVYAKGGISPDALGISRSVDGLVMVLLGGLNALSGPIWGAITFTWLQDHLSRSTDYWHALLGVCLLGLILLLPQGLASLGQPRWKGRD